MGDDGRHSDTQAQGFNGGAFDGRYVYLAPCCGDTAPGSQVGKSFTRHDTMPVTDAGLAWSLFATGALPLAQPGTSGAVFDGRRVLFVPTYVPPGGRNTESGVVSAFDTKGAFPTKTSWTQFDLLMLEERARNFQGGAFDGRYVYLLPSSNGPIARFDARTPKAPFDKSFASFF